MIIMFRHCLITINNLSKSKVFYCETINNVIKRHISANNKNFCKFNEKIDQNTDDSVDNSNLKSSFGDKYKVFRDEDSQIVFDVDEEKEKINLEDLNVTGNELDPYMGLNLKHGLNEVLTIENLVELLKRENARNIFVATVPKEYTYVNYIVVVTGKSYRHMEAIATFVRKAFKLTRYKTDKIPKIEGSNSKEWMAMDLGNIALHIFSTDAREKYDLETLWSVGSKYDHLTNKEEEEYDLMEKYNTFLKDLMPAE